MPCSTIRKHYQLLQSELARRKAELTENRMRLSALSIKSDELAINTFNYQLQSVEDEIFTRLYKERTFQMETTKFFNEALPAALTNNADAAKAINAKYQFNIQGAGEWTLDLTPTGPSCTQGKTDKTDCVVSISSTDFQTLLKNPSGNAVGLFMSGKLKVSNTTVGMRLQKVLGLVK